MKMNSLLICALSWAMLGSVFAAQTITPSSGVASAGPGEPAGGETHREAAASNHTDLLDAALSQWEIFIGVPHSSVTGLPEGTYQSNDVTKGTPLGLNNDPKKVFTTFTEGGVTVLHVSGEIYGGLTTKKDFANYHLEVDFKWGERQWEPRKKDKRDSGILYHCQGEHGAFWKVWKSCLEYQVQETDLGDLHELAGPQAKSRFRILGEKENIFDPHSPTPWSHWNGHLSASAEPDRPHGEWNHLEVYVLGDSAIHVANGIVVLALTAALDKNRNPLKSGQIQLQSEGAECFYRNVRISPLKAFPQDIAAKAGLTTDGRPGDS
jgi:hypothetical protein